MISEDQGFFNIIGSDGSILQETLMAKVALSISKL